MTHLVKKLAASRGVQQSAYTLVGNTTATIISGLALIFLSRILGPTEFGEFSVGFSLVLILTRINDLGFGPVLLKYLPTINDQNLISRIISYTLKTKIILGLGIAVAGLVLTPWLVSAMHFSQPLILYMAFLTTIFVTLYEHVLSSLQALHRFAQAVAINVLQASIKLVTITILLLWGWTSALPAFVLYMVAPIFAAATFPWLLPKWVKLDLTQSFSREKKVLAAMVPHAAVGFVVAGVIDNVDILFVRGYLNAYETGLLSGVSRISLFLMLIAYSLGNVLYPRVARYKDRADMRAYLFKASLVSLAAAVGFLLFIPFGPLTIWLTIGQEYLPGLPILLILMAAAFATLVIVPFQALFYSFEKPWYFSVTGIMQLVIVLIGNGVFVPLYGLEAAAWTRLVSRLALAVFTVGAGLIFYYLEYERANKRK